MQKVKVITISREFGSGGRSIAKAVAEKLNIPYYDKELIKQVSEKTGLSPDYVEENGEYAKKRKGLAYWLFSDATTDAMCGMTTEDFLWVMQRQVILDFAEKGPCVIVGRCSDYILKDRDDCLHIFIHASIDYRKERIVRLYGESEKKPEERLRDKDMRRRKNYKHYTCREWGAFENYGLSLDTSVIDIDKCVDIICDLYHSSNKE